jgi:asparagine synthase (glutamine-hydrolysing)
MQETVRRMADAISLRGPDDAGEWSDPNAGVALSHRRLSIIDLSQAGHQPMISPSGRYVIVYNGEIYNHNELLGTLEASYGRLSLRGHSDTEVMLNCFEAWGIEASVPLFNGMFAFAVWDSLERTLWVARDRLGEKPLYYGWTRSGVLVFGSQLRALKAYPDFTGDIDRDAVAAYLRYNCIPAPHSIYRGVYKLNAACLGRFGDDCKTIMISKYWNLKEVAVRGINEPFEGRDGDAIDELEQLLIDAVRIRTVSDVPLGVLLSGGIDSSLVAALAQHQLSEPVRTFSIGMQDRETDEAIYSRKIAQYLGTRHTELYISEQDALEVIPLLPSAYDEPFGDSSQIPTLLVARMARGHVTVALSGDGGDELFGGYNRYKWINKLWKALGWLPPGGRGDIARTILSIPTERWDEAYRLVSPFVPNKHKQLTFGDKVHKLASVLCVNSPQDMYLRLCSHWTTPTDVVCRSHDLPTVHTNPSAWLFGTDLMSQMMFLDTLTYLHDDILVKVDRAAMAVSLETRVPLLDHHLVAYSWRLPAKFKLRAGVSKWILRQILYRYVPRELMERPKSGFGIPLATWLRGPLREWGEDLLNRRRLTADGFFDVVVVHDMWQEHLSGKRNWAYHLWDLLMFQAWLSAENR